jgi:CRP-like cAMP-binding protein
MLGPGQYFGELSLLDRGPRTATVVADTDMTVLVLGQREFTAILDLVPVVSHKLLEAMAHRLRECDTRATSH